MIDSFHHHQAKHLPENDVQQLASLLPFITFDNDSSSSSCKDSREQAMKVAEATDRVMQDIGLKSTLREYEVPQTDFEEIVELLHTIY